jgi:hypothetical protein
MSGTKDMPLAILNSVIWAVFKVKDLLLEIGIRLEHENRHGDP